MPFELKYHPDIKTIGIPSLSEKMIERIKTAIESRLATAPHQYGEPLRKTLKGYWKLRVGDYRVIFKIVGNELLIFGIIHRNPDYEEIEKRM